MITQQQRIVGNPEHENVEINKFHEAMSRLGAGVSIVTTDGSAGRCGLTVTSVTSVSDDPPILLTCINHHARTCDILTQNHVFAVNVLGAHSEFLSNVFAGRVKCTHEQRFGHGVWHDRDGGTGAPLLKDALVALDCNVIDRIDSGTHRVFFGQVVDIYIGNSASALLYLDRGYKSI